MLDKDGKFVYSYVRKVNGDESDLVVSLYPNPVSAPAHVIITTSSNSYRLEVVDIQGRILKSLSVQGTRFFLPVYNLTAGTYLLNIYTEAGKKIEKLIVK